MWNIICNRDKWRCSVTSICLELVFKACSKEFLSWGSSDNHVKRHCLHFYVTLSLSHSRRISTGHTGMAASDEFPEAHRHLLCPLTPFLHLSKNWSWQLKSWQNCLCEVKKPFRIARLQVHCCLFGVCRMADEIGRWTRRHQQAAADNPLVS